MYYFLFIPAVIIAYMICAIMSYYNNTTKNNLLFIAIMIWGALPIWAFVSRYSKHLLFDGLLYDSLMTASFAITTIFLTNAKFSLINITGILLVISGLILIKH